MIFDLFHQRLNEIICNYLLFLSTAKLKLQNFYILQYTFSSLLQWFYRGDQTKNTAKQ